jgi:hypothetical protein
MLPQRFPPRLLLPLAAALLSASAQAVPRFPGEIAGQLQLSYAPPCSVCHLTNKVAGATVTTPFGYALRERGLTDRRTLSAALTRLTDDRTDSDGDGVPDTVELQNGTDPNSKVNASLIDVADPNFGCATSHPVRGTSTLLALTLGVAIASLGRARRWRRSP